jgi:hypothetical protein
VGLGREVHRSYRSCLHLSEMKISDKAAKATALLF